MMNARDLAFMLKRNADSLQEGDEGAFRIQNSRANLGSRTKREERPVFRVKRVRGDVPEAPRTRHVMATEIMKGKQP
jgi:hypothetical protein